MQKQLHSIVNWGAKLPLTTASQDRVMPSERCQCSVPLPLKIHLSFCTEFPHKSLHNVFVYALDVAVRVSPLLHCIDISVQCAVPHCTLHSGTLPHLKSFIESEVPPIRLFLMIIMMPLKRCVAKENYLIALLRNEARNNFFMSGPWLSIAKLRPLSFSAPRYAAVIVYLLLSSFRVKVGSE